LTKEGYIKQVPKESFKVQHRGGKGVTGMDTKDSDNVYYITTAMTHDFILFFTNQGRVFQNRVWDIPQGSRISKGKAIINLVALKPDEKITSILSYDNTVLDKAEHMYIVMSTKLGTVKKTSFKDYSNIRTNGIIAIRLEKNDELLWVKLTDGKANVILVSKNGKAIVFKEKEIRPTGRASIGVKGMELDENENQVISADVFADNEFKKDILVIGDRGVGKKTKLSNFKGQHRGGKGVKIAAIDQKFGHIAFAQIVEPEDTTLIITSASGQVVKISLTSIPSRSRTAKGVILMRFSQKTDRIVSATQL
jgi:DNA gyrase subunit A